MTTLEESVRLRNLQQSWDDLVADHDKLRDERDHWKREFEALQKAHDLLNKGFESTCELMDDLKQQNRQLAERCAAQSELLSRRAEKPPSPTAPS